MTEIEKKNLLSCGLFRGMEPGEREQILNCLHPEEVRYEKNEVLWQMGTPVRACAVILSGSVRAESVNASGEHSLMAIHREGALVGDVLMATPELGSPVYVLAEEPVTAVFLSFRQIMGGCSRCCDAHVKLRENLIGEIADKYWALRRRLSYLGTVSLRARLAMYLMDCAKEAGCDTFCVHGTRESMADFLCVNRSAMCRELSSMKEEALIDYYRDSFRILHREKLMQYIP